MNNIAKVLGMISYIACVIVGSYKFGWGGSLLCLAAWMSAVLYCGGKYAQDEDEEEPECDSQEDERDERETD